jgi:hypothetical protein
MNQLDLNPGLEKCYLNNSFHHYKKAFIYYIVIKAISNAD